MGYLFFVFKQSYPCLIIEQKSVIKSWCEAVKSIVAIYLSFSSILGLLLCFGIEGKMERFIRICNFIVFLCVLRGSCCLGSLENLELGVFSNATNLHWENLTESAAAFPPNTLMIGLTLIQGAAEAGAVCLDGTLPGYHLSEGWGSGARNWLIQLEGGGWCNDQRSCLYRKTTRRGSSKLMERAIGFVGILSNKHSENPDFYNWNRIKLRYCDGASFTGDREGDKQLPKTFFRGQRIWQAAIQDLLAKGMDKAQNALLSGCSAGGLASIIHCDEFREMMPKKSRVKCLSDAGFFLDTTDIAGERTLRSMFKGVVDIQGATKFLPRSCTSRMDPAQCFFPQHLIRRIKTPLFILNAAYDSWQIMSSLVPTSADHDGKWKTCRLDISKCSKGQLQLLHEFRDHMINALQQFSTNPVNGLFINSCFAHCQTEKTDTWFSVGSPKLKKSIAESVGDWYFERKSTNLTKNIDCPYPCDKSCHNLSFKPKKKTQLAS